MTILFRKHPTLISIILLMTFLVSVWIFPSARLMLMIIFLLFSVARAFASIIAKHREAYLQGRITPGLVMRNVLIESIGLLLAMILAGFLGWYIAQIATQPISNDLSKSIAGIIIGLLVGIAVGVVMQHIWGRFIKTSAEN
jgi:hypothetical protein